MHHERWLEIKNMIRERFTVVDSGTVELEGEPGTREFIIFESPLGTLKCEGITRPAIVGHRVIATKRMGQAGTEKNIYDPDHDVFLFHLYRWSDEDNDWQPADTALDAFSL